MNRTIYTPILILAGIGLTMALMAVTSLFKPLIVFIHSGSITPFQAVLCTGFTILGFWGCYFLLNRLCGYFVPRIEAGDTPCKENEK